MHDLTNFGNLIEAGLWGVVAIVMLFKALRDEARFRRVFAGLAVAFLIFGLSDIIESRTGAWWRPWWLFVMKAGCVIAFLVGFTRYYQLRKKSPQSARDT